MLTCHMRRAGTHSSLARPPPRPVGTIATRTIIRTDPHLFSRRLCRRAGAERYSGFAVCLLAGHASVARCLPRAHTAARMLLRAGAGPAQDGLAVGIRARREARGARREARTCAVRPGPAVRVGAGGGARTPRASRRRQGGGRAAAPLRIQSNCMLPSRGSPPQRCAAGMRLGARGASRAARAGRGGDWRTRARTAGQGAPWRRFASMRASWSGVSGGAAAACSARTTVCCRAAPVWGRPLIVVATAPGSMRHESGGEQGGVPEMAPPQRPCGVRPRGRPRAVGPAQPRPGASEEGAADSFLRLHFSGSRDRGNVQ